MSKSFEAITTLAVGIAITVVTIAFEVTGVALTHAALDVNTTVTELEFTNSSVVNVELSVPTSSDPIFHWYVGAAPPFVEVAVKVTLVPAHILLSKSFEAITTLAVGIAITVVTIAFEVTGVALTHAALDVNTTVTELEFTNSSVVNVELSVPTSSDPIFHWYVGAAPPFVEVAVKVTLVPAHILLSKSFEAITTLAVGIAITVVTIAFEV